MLGDGGRNVENWSVLMCKGDAGLYMWAVCDERVWAFGGRKIMKMLFYFLLLLLFFTLVVLLLCIHPRESAVHFPCLDE